MASVRGLRRSAVLLVASCCTELEANLVGQSVGGRGLRGRRASVGDLERSLVSFLSSAQSGADSELTADLDRIRTALAPTFKSLPKNSRGLLDPASVRYLVRSFLANQHGWQIFGLGPQTLQQESQEAEQAEILQARVPGAVEALLEHQRNGEGLDLADVTSMVALLERIVLDEARSLLEVAYSSNEIGWHEPLDLRNMTQVLDTYLVMFRSGRRDLEGRDVVSAALQREDTFTNENRPTFRDLSMDTIHNKLFAERHVRNPFKQASFGVDAAEDLTFGLARSYGRWQHQECTFMKEELMELDAHGSGSVALSTFYAAGGGFTESKDYLRRVGALDESTAWAPRVRIANYLVGPSNCLDASSFFSVCCLNECGDVMLALEASIQAPTATVDAVLRHAGVVATATVDAPRQLAGEADLVRKLQAVADRNGGEVPLHGRLFAQWLHHAFPNECPYPAEVENTTVLSTKHWQTTSFQSSHAERQQFKAEPPAEDLVPPRPVWSDEEVLFLQPRETLMTFTNFVRFSILCSMLMALVRVSKLGFDSVLGSAANGKKKALLPTF